MARELFKKPKWLQPEINEFKYWIHLLIITLVVYNLVSWFIQPMEINVTNVLQGVAILGIADIFAHTILKIR